ncbi:L-piperidine-6-carboxylate dehydrogenase [Actinokineospora inagensis]|uniref:L-piperidine-6-carboxylate dehydrogenase n=1 Tax=Actinokineospora inagensis TaxID=103730 RepID=UPI0004051FAE|nr:aldehyde dehydrogenase family protein [Actinokineospora inagensis]
MTALPTHPEVAALATGVLARLGVPDPFDPGGDLACRTPVTGGILGRVRGHRPQDVDALVGRADHAFQQWRRVPAPARGQVVRELGQLLREHKRDLGLLVSIEAGKILAEGLGEVQEMIDICELAVGQSRQLFGRIIASERPGHRLMEQWHPLGVVGVLSAFNFPVAVWSWNTAIALVCGNTVVWKPSEHAVLTALACDRLLAEAAVRAGAPDDLGVLALGAAEVGAAVVDDPRVALVSATGSTETGRAVAGRVANRFGRCLLELGGNNAAVVCPSADLDLTVRSIVFAAAGTAGQRCTTLRRVIAHASVADELAERLVAAYRSLPIGSPLDEGTLVGPVINAVAHERHRAAVEQAVAEGGRLLHGGDRVLADDAADAWYVQPTLIDMPEQTAVVRRETFSPLLYLLTYTDLADAIELNNAVPQGLSSAIFTRDVREAELFVSATGSDCGIVNVNTGPSGAEIGGAFGGEKETGGGRESGSDAWKGYMRRATSTVNYSSDLPLAQGVSFG